MEQCLSLDVSRLRRPGYLEPNNLVPLGRITWASGQNIGFTLRTEATEGELWPFYSVNGQAAPRYVVHLATTRPPFGGLRWWFLCPWCHRRARYLYLSPRNGRFECRLCCDLTYRSAQEHDKAMDWYMRLPLGALSRVMDGSGGDSFRAVMAFDKHLARLDRRMGSLGNAGIIGDQKTLGA